MDEPASEFLASCYRQALHVAERARISSIAFPAISTDAFGYPMEKASRVALEAIVKETPHLQKVSHIRMVLFDEADWQIHCAILHTLSMPEG